MVGLCTYKSCGGSFKDEPDRNGSDEQFCSKRIEAGVMGEVRDDLKLKARCKALLYLCFSKIPTLCIYSTDGRLFEISKKYKKEAR